MKKILSIPSLFSLFLLLPFFTIAQLTGYWQTDVGGCYQIRQSGNEVWWAGESPNSQRPTNVFHGTIAGNVLTGQWCDLPSNPAQACEQTLALRLEGNSRLVKTTSSVNYNGSVWTKLSGPCGTAGTTSPKLFGVFHINHIHQDCSTPNCPVLNKVIPFDIDFTTKPNGEIEGKATDTNRVTYKGTLSGTTFSYKYYKGGQYLGYGTFYFEPDFKSFKSTSTFVDVTNGHRGIIWGNK